MPFVEYGRRKEGVLEGDSCKSCNVRSPFRKPRVPCTMASDWSNE